MSRLAARRVQSQTMATIDLYLTLERTALNAQLCPDLSDALQHVLVTVTGWYYMRCELDKTTEITYKRVGVKSSAGVCRVRLWSCVRHTHTLFQETTEFDICYTPFGMCHRKFRFSNERSKEYSAHSHTSVHNKVVKERYMYLV